MRESGGAGGSVWYERRLRKASFDKKSVDWASFRKFVANSCCERVVKDRVRYAKKFGYCLLKKDFGELNTFSDSKRGHVLKALSGLAKFLGVYEDFKKLVKAYGLKARAKLLFSYRR